MSTQSLGVCRGAWLEPWFKEGSPEMFPPFSSLSTICVFCELSFPNLPIVTKSGRGAEFRLILSNHISCHLWLFPHIQVVGVRDSRPAQPHCPAGLSSPGEGVATQHKIIQIRSQLLGHMSHISSTPRSHMVQGYPVGERRHSSVDRQQFHHCREFFWVVLL